MPHWPQGPSRALALRATPPPSRRESDACGSHTETSGTPGLSGPGSWHRAAGHGGDAHVILKGGTNVGCLCQARGPHTARCSGHGERCTGRRTVSIDPPHQAMAPHPGSHFRPGSCGVWVRGCDREACLTCPRPRRWTSRPCAAGVCVPRMRGNAARAARLGVGVCVCWPRPGTSAVGELTCTPHTQPLPLGLVEKFRL